MSSIPEELEEALDDLDFASMHLGLSGGDEPELRSSILKVRNIIDKMFPRRQPGELELFVTERRDECRQSQK